MHKQYNFLIVTPSYNQAHFIQDTIDGLECQTLPYYHFVSDGGSTDDTVKVLKKNQDLLDFVSEKDEGQTDAINKGLKLFLKKFPDADPETTIVAYINSDDYYFPGAFQVVKNAFYTYPSAKWLVGDCVIIDAEGNEIQKPIRWYKKFWRSILTRSILGVLNPIPQPAVFFRLSALKKTGLFTKELRYTMDYEYWLRLWQSCGAPLVVDAALSAFRIHEASKGVTRFGAQFAEEQMVAKQFSKNPILHFLHYLHANLIVGVYKLLK